MDNMKVKKEEILDASRVLFSERGFRDASVQEIAKYCKVSKATIYKLFNSKEELLVTIINKINVEVFEEIENIKCNKEKDSIKKLEKKLEIFLSSWNAKRKFVNMIYENQTLMKDIRVKELIIENKKVVLNWYKKILLEAFEEKIKDKLDEISVVLNGVIKELKSIELIYMREGAYVTDFKKISEFLVSIVVALVEKKDDIKEFLTVGKVLSPLEEEKMKKALFLSEWHKKVDNIEFKLKNKINESDEKNIIEAIEELTNEIEKDVCREFLVESIILYLERYEIIQEEIEFLKKALLSSENKATN